MVGEPDSTGEHVRDPAGSRWPEVLPQQRCAETAADPEPAEQQRDAVRACAEIAEARPECALDLLRHLAGSGHPQVRRDVVAVLHRIGLGIGPSRLLRCLTGWFERAPANRLGVLAEAVTGVLGACGEGVDSVVAHRFWQLALGAVPPDDLRPLARSWLRPGADVEPLVQAARRDPHRIARLWYASRPDPGALHRGGPDEAVTEVLHRLWTRLDEVDPIWAWE